MQQRDPAERKRHWERATLAALVLTLLLLLGSASSMMYRGYLHTATVEALERADSHVFRRLLLAGADPMTEDISRYTMLHHAAADGNVELVRELLARGVPVDLVTDGNETPLFLAAKSGKPGTVAQLIAAGARVEAKNSYGQTPLLFAKAYVPQNRGVYGSIVRMLERAGAKE